MARKTKLTPELQERFVHLVRLGLTYERACEAAGIGKTTLYRWLAAGEKSTSGPYRDFWSAVKKADAEAEAYLLRQILDAVENRTWQAAAWFLERRWPERWGRPERKLPSSSEPVTVVLRWPETPPDAEAEEM